MSNTKWYRQKLRDVQRRSPLALDDDPYVEFSRTGLIRIVDARTGQHVTLWSSRHGQQVIEQIQLATCVNWPDSDRFEEIEHE